MVFGATVDVVTLLGFAVVVTLAAGLGVSGVLVVEGGLCVVESGERVGASVGGAAAPAAKRPGNPTNRIAAITMKKRNPFTRCSIERKTVSAFRRFDFTSNS